MAQQVPYKPLIGIDLGTTYSCVGLFTEEGTVQILNNEHGSTTTASVLAFEENEYVTVGAQAYERAEEGAHLAYDVKRLIGRGKNDA